MKTALTIAGSDSSGGAGIQADIKTMTANGVYAMSAITALTAQNTTGVYGIYEVTPEFLREQLYAVFSDIRPDAVKVGMVSSSALIDVIADALERFCAPNIVVDPVMVSTSGSRLIDEDAVGNAHAQAAPARRHHHAQHPRGGNPVRDRNKLGGRHGKGGAENIGVGRRRSFMQGRAQHRRRKRSALLRRLSEMVLRRAHRQQKHARDGLHAFERYRLKSRKGIRPCKLRSPGEGIYFVRAVRGARSRSGQRSARSHRRSSRQIHRCRII